jgi:hypothetical protein
LFGAGSGGSGPKPCCCNSACSATTGTSCC